ncbi:MFS transporter [Herbaspirillum sp. AP02]|uniref:MFS transporter n=1 Tax=unclassified Herbaspirillum TaxID=2624150 RepID=UPI0015DBAE58|nr:MULTISPECIES: MFS transporter [unclassified Herbaspirillum]MBG7621109.1 MFS transporter [Herbaspirillum sp. AP02]NZD68838.1 MFS transporter [Herbaspirillum sp. AP21]
MQSGVPSTDKRTKVRYLILAMIFIVTVFNYVDRATLSIAAPAMRKDLGFDAVTMGIAFSAFGWAYTIMQIPGGILLDRIGSRVLYGLSLIIWSIFTFLQGYVDLFSSAFLVLFTLRFLMGIAEAPAFPANNRLTVMWFPKHERGLATAVFQSAQYFALAAFTPIMTWTLSTWGWHHIFFVTGAAGIGLGVIWFAVVQEPKKHKLTNQAEIAYIEQGGGMPTIGDVKTPFSWANIKSISANRMMVGIYLGQFCLTSITWFFLTWFPTYLMEAKGMSILKVGLVAAIPPLAGFIGGMVGGIWSDWMIRRGYSLTAARKTPIIIGLFASCSIIVANYVSSVPIVIAVMSLAFFAKGVGNLGWCIVGDVSPKESMGIAGGMFNLFGNLASIVTPIAIGYFVKTTGSFDAALTYVGVVAAIGACSYLFIVGKLERLDADDQGTPSAQASANGVNQRA